MIGMQLLSYTSVLIHIKIISIINNHVPSEICDEITVAPLKFGIG